jgi:glucokinase
MSDLLLALDFGGTKLSAAVLQLQDGRPEQEWEAQQRAFSPAGADAQYSIKHMLSMARELLRDRQPSAVGVSFGGPVNAVDGIVRLSHHVPGWENIHLADLLERELAAPAALDNDANTAAAGEFRFGAGQGYSSLFYITVSTGVGGGWILNGKPWSGANGMAGEIGHMVIDPDGPVCSCGKRGCVERLASGPSMAQNARDLLQAGPEQLSQASILLKLAGGELSGITAKIISQAAAQGDLFARQVMEAAARSLGLAVGNTANLMNPQLFVIGGGVSKSGPLYWDSLRKGTRETALPHIQTKLLPAALGDDAPLWGAAGLALDLRTS